MRVDVCMLFQKRKWKQKLSITQKKIYDRTLGSSYEKKHLGDWQLLSVVALLNLHYVKIMSGKCSNEMANNNRVGIELTIWTMVGNFYFNLITQPELMISNRASMHRFVDFCTEKILCSNTSSFRVRGNCDLTLEWRLSNGLAWTTRSVISYLSLSNSQFYSEREILYGSQRKRHTIVTNWKFMKKMHIFVCLSRNICSTWIIRGAGVRFVFSKYEIVIHYFPLVSQAPKRL